jgi:hypothetical protein
MPHVRPDLLRRFYEARWDGGVSPETLYRDATFDEYFALWRLQFPLATRRSAAEGSPLERFRALADAMPPDPEPSDPPGPKLAQFDRRASLDLAAEAFEAGVEGLVFDRIKAIAGWASLARFPHLRLFDVLLSGTADREGPPAPVPVDTVEVRECSAACLQLALRATRARSLAFSTQEPPVVDLGALAHHTELRELAAGAPLVRGLAHLGRWPLTSLTIGLVHVDEALREGLGALSGSLEQLTLSTADALPPDALPELGGFARLRRVQLSIQASPREAWIDYAVAHPALDFVFTRLVPPAKAPRVSLAEIHRGVDILRVELGKKVSFEIASDLAPDFDAEDNEALEARARALAKAAKKKLSWSSEADTFVASAPDAATLRWLIDALHAPPKP